MFFGEFSCLVVFKLLLWRYVGWRRHEDENQDEIPSVLRGSRSFNPFIFLAPTVCDMIGTTTMYIGLNLTYASSAQMFRGEDLHTSCCSPCLYLSGIEKTKSALILFGISRCCNHLHRAVFHDVPEEKSAPVPMDRHIVRALGSGNRGRCRHIFWRQEGCRSPKCVSR